MQPPYPGYPGLPYESGYSPDPNSGYGASFGAEGDAPMADLTPAPLSNGWTRIQLWTPDCVKQALTIAVGVFGGLSLFRMFSHRVPKGTAQ